MSNTYKVLGQINPSANTQSNVYVVPAATQVAVNSITIANQSASNASYSLIVMPSNLYSSSAPANTFIIRGGVIPGADAAILTLSLGLPTGAIIAANTNSSNISFSVFGVEIT
jgi:hypothetical protein